VRGRSCVHGALNGIKISRLKQMPSCFVPYCQPYKIAESSGDRPSFFLPPKDETLFLKWKNALPKRNDEELSHTSKVCHRHFLNEEIIRFNEYKILKMGSVPSIFPTSTGTFKKILFLIQ